MVVGAAGRGWHCWPPTARVAGAGDARRAGALAGAAAGRHLELAAAARSCTAIRCRRWSARWWRSACWCAVAALIARRPSAARAAGGAGAALPVPIQAGGETSNLLVPLYFVVAAGALAWIVPALPRTAGTAPSACARAGPRAATAPTRARAQVAAGRAAADPRRLGAAAARPVRRALRRSRRSTRRTSRRRCRTWSSSTSRSRCSTSCCATWSGRRAACATACGCSSALALVFSLIGFYRVRHQDDHPQPQAGRRQRPAHLLHGQLGVLRPRHLRPLPGAGDDPAGRRCCSTRARGASSWRS